MTAICDTLPKCVMRNAREQTGALAMRRKTLGIWQRIDWGEIGARVEAISAGLLTLDLADEECIGVIGDNEPELFWAEWGIQAAGRVAHCLYPDIPIEELRAALNEFGIRTVFAEDQQQCDKLLEIAGEIGLKRIIYWDGRGLTEYDEPLLMALEQLMETGRQRLKDEPDLVAGIIERGSGDDLAVVIGTSGTTGSPKGVMGSHRYLLDIAERWRSILDARPGTQYVSYISPAWATEQYLGIALGASLPMVVNFPEEPETVNSDMREIGPEFLFFSPRQWESVVSSTEARMQDAAGPMRAFYRWAMKALARRAAAGGGTGGASAWFADLVVGRALRDRLGFSNLRTAVNSGSTLSPEVFEFFRALGISLRNVYGFTEIGIVTATGDGDPGSTVGKLLTSTLGEKPLEIRIADDEIQVRGGVIFDGYYRSAETSAERFTADGWVRSGDAGRIDEGNRLVYLDRLDDLRKLAGGRTIAPQYIETRIRLSPYIRDVIVVGEGRESSAALVDIDMEMVGHWAEENRISYTSQVDLSQHEAVYGLIEGELRRINETFPEHERIDRFLNLFKPFDADEGELTRSRKLRRSVVEQKYASLIDGLYGSRPSIAASVEMKYQDGRTRVLNTQVAIRVIGETRIAEATA